MHTRHSRKNCHLLLIRQGQYIKLKKEVGGDLICLKITG
jgi:hypothetical protein